MIVALAVLRAVLRALWWLLRALAWLAWRVTLLVLAALLFVACLAFSPLRRPAWQVALMGVGLSLTRGGAVVPRSPEPGRQEGVRGADRGSGNVPEAKLRPVSAQKVATARELAPRPYGVWSLSGPGQLALWVGGSGMGKTELKLGAWRAQYDGEDFCGLATTRGGKKLWLTEMERDLARAFLRRHGFLVEPNGRLDRVRLALWTPRHSPGAYLDIEYASDVFTPDATTGAVTDWPRVLARLVASGAGERYDEVAVDTMAEWLGSDNNDAASESLGLCKQLTKRGAGVTVLHHTPLADARRPKGGQGVWRAVDLIWALYGVGPGDRKRTLKDPERYLECLKNRRQEDAPDAPLRIVYAPADPDAGRPLPRYRLVDAAPAGCNGADVSRNTEPDPAPAPTLTDRQRRALVFLRGASGGVATTPEVAAALRLDGDRTRETLTALKDKGLAVVAGTGTAHAKGSKPATLWRATPLAIAVATESVDPQLTAGLSQTPDTADRLLREAFDG